MREKSAGPSYLEIARKYQNDAPAREKLAAKIISGGGGVWGREGGDGGQRGREEAQRSEPVGAGRAG
ncbi:hypothetical protein LBMAG56_25270 [Verrucomicrobiota bacterium]|nr:hypothetical protein LBMAG56_25270 [Verrucomicrobiota bacterium]